MFKKKKQAGLLPGQDAHQLLEAMDKIANANFDTYNSLTPNWYYKVLR